MDRPKRREEEMKKALWLCGASIAAALACGAAGAQDRFLTAQFGGMDMPQIVPPPKSKQSPAATACATGGGRIELDARIAACTSLIASDKWKGKDIGWAYANRCAVYSAQGRDDKALADCVQAILLDPDSVVPYRIRGDIALKRGESTRRLRIMTAPSSMARDISPPSLSIRQFLVSQGRVGKSRGGFQSGSGNQSQQREGAGCPWRGPVHRWRFRSGACRFRQGDRIDAG